MQVSYKIPLLLTENADNTFTDSFCKHATVVKSKDVLLII